MTKEEALKHVREYKKLKDIFDEIQDLDEKDLAEIYIEAAQYTYNENEDYFIWNGHCKYNNNFDELMELIPIEILTKYPQICKEGAKIDGYNVRYIPSEVLKENIDIIDR